MADLNTAPTEPTGSPEHQARLIRAKALEEKAARGPAKVMKQWIEVHKRVQNEVGKVLLKTTTDSGCTHSWYVGREPKCIAWMKEQIKDSKLEIFNGPRVDEFGRPGIPYRFPGPVVKK